jgi:hypothetical protein
VRARLAFRNQPLPSKPVIPKGMEGVSDAISL